MFQTSVFTTSPSGRPGRRTLRSDLQLARLEHDGGFREESRTMAYKRAPREDINKRGDFGQSFSSILLECSSSCKDA